MSTAQPVDVIVLDRIEPGVVPPYCTHGRATCVACDEWVWLGDKTGQAVTSKAALPLCLQCARRLLPPTARPVRNLGDHRRADGPHS